MPDAASGNTTGVIAILYAVCNEHVNGTCIGCKKYGRGHLHCYDSNLLEDDLIVELLKLLDSPSELALLAL